MRVAELWRYPVKSLRGERLERAELQIDGVRGDRLTRVLAAGGSELTSRTARPLMTLSGSLSDGDEPLIDGEPWNSPQALELVRAAAGEGTTLTPIGRNFDEAPILVVTDGAVAALGEDRRRFRPNIVVEGVEGLDERDWVGRRLRVGPAELLVRQHCARCVITTIDPDTLEVRPEVLRRINEEFEGLMGVYCEVALAGEVREGDPVEIT